MAAKRVLEISRERREHAAEAFHDSSWRINALYRGTIPWSTGSAAPGWGLVAALDMTATLCRSPS